MEPAVLLLDEPLSNLDAQLREEMRAELRELHARLGVTVVYVTHDQSEAMAMSDRIMVLLAGRPAQIGTPRELYEHPVDPVVAGVCGRGQLPARRRDRTRRSRRPGAAARWDRCARADRARHGLERPRGGRAPARRRWRSASDGELAGRVSRASYLGNRIEYVVQVGELAVRVEGRAEDVARPGDAVRLAVRRAMLYPDAASAVTSSGDRTT